MAVNLRTPIIILVLMAGSLGLVWQISTEEQRREYLTWLHLAKPQADHIEEPLQDKSIDSHISSLTQHGSPIEYRCAPKTRSISEVENTTRIYKWTDEHGRVQFSDQVSKAASVEDLSQRYQKKAQYFRVKVEMLGTKLPARTKDKLTSGTRQIFTILAEQLEIKNLRQVDLNVKLFDNRFAYQKFARDAVGGVGKWSSGFYNAGINTTAVLHQGRDGDTHQVALHESTHVIMAGLFGLMPTWFTEGMAEYFEHLTISGQSKTVHPDLPQLFYLQKRPLPDLQNWFDQQESWYSDQNRELNYAVAWSLTHFMMQQDWTKKLLAGYMRAMSKDLCQPVYASQYFAAHYPGGIGKMTRDWKWWVKLGRATPHYF